MIGRGIFSELQSRSLRELSTIRMPTVREEEYRFTDISPIIQSDIKKTGNSGTQQEESIAAVSLEKGWLNRIVVFNGKIRWDLSNLETDLEECVKDARHFVAPEDVVMPCTTFNNCQSTSFMATRVHRRPSGEALSPH